MLMLVYMLNVIIILLVRLYYDALHNALLSRTSATKENITIENLIPTSILQTWMGENTVENCVRRNETCLDNSLRNIVDSANKSSELKPEFESYIDTLFNLPSEKVIPDWNIVLGSFSFYAEENWRNFLIKAEAPILIRMVIENISEVLSFSRKFKENRKVKKRMQSEEEEKSEENHEMLYRTKVWFISHDISFRLNEEYTEFDFVDGDTSENLFFFLAPRLLVQNKFKLNHRVAMLFHFDEANLNITFFDRDAVTMARRFYKRIE